MKNRMKRRLLACSFWVIVTELVASTGLTHMPSFNDGTWSGPETAFVIEDLEPSILVYNEVTCDSEQLWLTFDADPGADLFVQLGRPLLERLSDYYPAMAILGKDFPEPEQDLPFAIPDGMGAVVIETDADTEIVYFFEEFSETEFEIMYEETYTLEQGGVGYMVAYHPQRRTGKLWAAVGTREDFDPATIEKYVAAQSALEEFHEVDGEKTAQEAPAEYCGEKDRIANADCSMAPIRAFRSLLTSLVQIFSPF